MNQQKNKSALMYAKEACDMMMRKFPAPKLPPEGHFHYHQGVFLSGMYQTYLLSGEERYFTYIKEWVDSILDDEDGRIHWYDPGKLDDIQPGILLFPLYERTREKKYKKALDELMERIDHFPVNSDGGFWHMAIFPHQMWLDGLYMAGPVCAQYAKIFKKPEYAHLSAKQALLMEEKTRDLNTGLWYHAWDESKKESWADKQTGRSPEFWGRSIGWVPVAVLDELDCIPADMTDYGELCRLVKELLIAVCCYQSEDGRWYQVINKGSEDKNWLENSCSCLFTSALCKAVRTGILDVTYLEKARKGYEGVLRSLTYHNGDLQIGDVCIGTGVGDYLYYCSRPKSVNDLHGIGAFLLMCTEVERITEKERCLL